MHTFYGKSQHYGHNAETNIDLPNGMTLKIRTAKRSNGSLETTATCCVRKGNFETYRVFQDFMKTVAVEACRCTTKAVEKQHSLTCNDIESIKQRAINHYNTPEYVSRYGFITV